MKITKLHYFDTFEIFQGNRRFTKIGFEMEIDDDFENVRDCYYVLKRKSEELFYESNKADEKKAENPIKEIYLNMNLSNDEMLIKNINSCSELKVLESYKLIVKGKPELETAYNNRLKELT